MNQERKGDEALPGIGLVLKSIREQAGLSRRALDRKANIGESVIGRIEAGRAACNTRTLAAWLDACGHDLSTLLGYAVDKPVVVTAAPAAPRGKKGHDYSRLPAMVWKYEESMETWVAMEMLHGWPKEYRIVNNGTAWQFVEKNLVLRTTPCLDVEHGKLLVNEWRFVHGYQLE